MIELVLNYALLFFDSDYAAYYEDSSNNELNFEKILEYILYSDWYNYFSEDTLLLFGELVVYLSRDDYATAKELVIERYDEDVEYFWTHLRIKDFSFYI